MVSHTPVKLGGHVDRVSGDIMVLVCRMILQDLLIKGSYDFMGGTSLWQATPPVKLGRHMHCGRRVLQDHMTKE